MRELTFEEVEIVAGGDYFSAGFDGAASGSQIGGGLGGLGGFVYAGLGGAARGAAWGGLAGAAVGAGIGLAYYYYESNY